MIAEKQPNSQTQQHQSSELYEALLAARMPGEQVLWWGCPNARRVRKKSSAPTFVVAFVWFVFSVIVFPLAGKSLGGGIATLFLLALGIGIFSAAVAEYRKAAKSFME